MNFRTMRGTWTTGCLAGWTFFPKKKKVHTLWPIYKLDWAGTIERITTHSTHSFSRADRTNAQGLKTERTQKGNLRDLPVWRPFLLASFRKVTRAREWTTFGFLMIKPSRWRRAMLRRELARAISLISLGSNQILRFPHFNTEEARRFWSLRETTVNNKQQGKKA